MNCDADEARIVRAEPFQINLVEYDSEQALVDAARLGRGIDLSGAGATGCVVLPSQREDFVPHIVV
jgi:hypothetical protein